MMSNFITKFKQQIAFWRDWSVASTSSTNLLELKHKRRCKALCFLLCLTSRKLSNVQSEIVYYCIYIFIFTFNRAVESFGPASIVDRASTCPGKTDETDRSIWALVETSNDFIHPSETLRITLRIMNPMQTVNI